MASDLVTEVAESLAAMAHLPYMGEPVDQRAHALQAAGFALAAGADDELVVATLLHDIARVSGDGSTPHARAGAEWCGSRFSDRVAWLVGAHVSAKRYLVATDPSYGDDLTGASQESLRHQGGPFTPTEAAQFAGHPWAADAVRLRRWDDAAKVPGAPEPEEAVVLQLVAAVGAPPTARRSPE